MLLLSLVPDERTTDACGDLLASLVWMGGRHGLADSVGDKDGLVLRLLQTSPPAPLLELVPG